MQRPSFQLMLLFGGLGLLFSAVSGIFIYQNNLTEGTTDLAPRYIGAEHFFKDGISPYDEQIGIESQQYILGDIAEPDQDQVLFAYPFYTVFYIGPLVLLDYQIAATIVMEILLIGLLAAMGLSLHMVNWLPSPLMLATLLLFTIASYFSMRGLLLAQLAIVGYVGHIIALWAIYREKDYLAGFGLALSTIKPQTGYLVVPILLLWALRYRRYGLVISFGVLFGVLMGLSFILEPSWFSDWFKQITEYQNYTETIAAVEVVTRPLGDIQRELGDAAQGLLTLLILLPVAMFWRRDPIHHMDLMWGYFLTMTVSLMVAPRTATTYYVELYPVFYVTVMFWLKRWASWQVIAAIFALVIGYWIIFLTTVPPKDEHGVAGGEAGIVYVIFPVLTLALLMIYRKDWLNAASS